MKRVKTAGNCLTEPARGSIHSAARRQCWRTARLERSRDEGDQRKLDGALGAFDDRGRGRHLVAVARFARHEPGIDVVLFGTGDAQHLEANVASLFGHLVGVGLDRPKP